MTFGHLCVVAREQITADLAIDNFEWKERIKARILALGFTYPTEPDAIDRALRAVEAALAREGRTRPGPGPTPAADTPPAPPAPDAEPLTRDEARRILANLGATVKAIPKASRLTRHAAAAHRASELVAREIVESIARCEAAERALRDENGTK